ncbi:cupin domain-containing protein [Roseivivax isoporae]|uniref:Cupin n=1 Tax=Roseivivax isoporae LMG 25204 TaxID=1449351 RepID=X7FD34_9RHOB|nr:cupin domain-containing protein [Roseivivax isoporae]ETX29964.1 cupin [Roseivivax isoporae LMG 25204]
MTQPIHIPYETPEVKVMEEATRGGLRYRLMVDADHGPSSGVTQGMFYLDGGHAETRHRHGVTETVHVVEGTGHAVLGDREIAIKTGDTLFIPAGTRHGFAADDDMTLFFTFPADRFAEVDYDYGEAA